jgi:hypothetical protein|tara:strand:- start:29 stop:430 length:402 start_codon:yes stop_codon:yes gene_type:complete
MEKKIVLTIKDETFAGQVLNEVLLEFENSSVTLKEIIEARVRNEVQNYNTRLNGFYTGLVEPTNAERTLNGYKIKPARIIDEEKQVYVALEAFLKNAYFVLVDDKQAESLDEEVVLAPYRSVSFVKLTPLVGG